MLTDEPEQTGDQITVGNIANAQAVAIGTGATAIYQGLSVEEVAVLVAELKRVDQPTMWDGRIPYLGLSAFQESDAQFFFGRESLVDDLLKRVTAANFIVIAGPSGSGKSSVARAGLFHALRNGRLDKSDTWLLATMTPGGNPIEQLAAAVVRVAKTPSAGDHIRQQGLENGLALLEQIDALLSDDPRQRFVLLVDQFEETFTQTKDEATRAAFLNLLTAAAQTPDSRAIILLALRSDFISHCARYPELRELMSQQFQLVGAMEPHELAKAITLPALEVGTEIDPALVSRIIADMKGEPGALPLMSFALRDLFEFEARKTQKGKPLDLTLPDYLARGGVESALERHANQVFANFTEEQQELAKTVFSRLIEVGQGRQDTRRTAVFTELVPAGKDAAAVTAVVDALAREGARLLTASGGRNDEAGAPTETTVTIAHEKLIDAWPWLRQLVDENREAIALQNQIANDAKAWGEGQDAGYLYRGGRLAQVEERLAELGPSLDELSKQFIQASLEAKEAEQRAEAERIQKEETLRQQQATAHRFLRFTQGLSLAVVVAVVALIAAVILGNSARQQATIADEARGMAEAAQATSDANAALASFREAEALVAQATATFNEEIAVTREAMALTAEAEAREAEAEVQKLKRVIQSLQLAAQAELASQNNDELARRLAIMAVQTTYQFDGSTAGEVRVILCKVLSFSCGVRFDEYTDGIESVKFRPDGTLILITSYYEGVARLRKASDGQWISTFGVGGERVTFATFDPTGNFIVTGGDGGTVTIWDTIGNELAVLSGHTETITAIAFSPDGETIVTASGDRTARIWSGLGVEIDNAVTVVSHEDWVTAALFSPDGQNILTASLDGTVRVWDRQGNELLRLVGHTAGIYLVEYSPDGQNVLTASVDGTARLWDGSGEPLLLLVDEDSWFKSATFSADGQTILTVNANGTAKLWNSRTADELTTFEGDNSIQFGAFSLDGKQVVTVSEDNFARLWDSATGELLDSLEGPVGQVLAAAFNQEFNGFRLVTARVDNSIWLWDFDPGIVGTLLFEAQARLTEAFSEDECKLYFREDTSACPTTLEALFPRRDE